VKKKNTKTNKKQTNKQTNKQTKKKSAIFDGKYVHMHNKYLLLFALGNGLISRARLFFDSLAVAKKKCHWQFRVVCGNLELCGNFSCKNDRGSHSFGSHQSTQEL
jgi:hypothetical protein